MTTNNITPFNLPAFKTYSEAYYKLVDYIHNHGDKVEANGSEQREISAAGFSVENIDNMIAPLREMSVRYAIAELIWYWKGSNSTEWISHFSKFWTNITDDGKTANSAYGYLLKSKWGFSQIDKVIEQLNVDVDSRRATIKINTPRTALMNDNLDLISTKDEWCTLSLQFLIRNNKLNMVVNMRSNDLWAGIPYDVIYFTSIQKYIVRELKKISPEKFENLEYGTYTHFVGSMHEYSNRFEKFDELLNKHTVNEQPKINIDVLALIDDADELYDWVEKEANSNKYNNDKDFRFAFDEKVKKYLLEAN